MIFLYDIPGWLLFAAGFLLLFRLTSSFIRTYSLIYFFYTLSALSLLIAGFGAVGKTIFGADFVEWSVLMTEWGRITSVALLMSGLTALIREAKPPFARFPRVFCAFPLTIIAAHYFGMHAAVLKEWVIGIYEAGSLVIGLVMYASYLRRDYQFIFVISGLILFLFAFITFWFREFVLVQSDHAWKLMFSAGIFFVSYGLSRTESHFKSVAKTS